MTEQLPEEVFIVGYRYRDNADDVSKLFKLNRPIEKKDIIEVFGDDNAFLKPVESDLDPYCVAVYDIETEHIGYVWMLQAPTMRRWLETHNEDFISIRITGTIPAANVLLGVMEEPLDVPMTYREFNNFDHGWASNLPGILRGDSEECLDMQLKLLCKELSKAKEWNKILDKSISNLFKSIPLDLSSYRHNIYMDLFVKMRKSEIKEVREKSDEMLNTLLYRGSKDYMMWWTDEWLPEYFRKVSEGHLFKLFVAAHYTLDIVEELLEDAPANLFHLYKADKIAFVRRLYYYALPKDAYNRLLTLLAVREAMLEKADFAQVSAPLEPNKQTSIMDDEKQKTLEMILKSNAKIGNFVMDNHGTMTLSANMGEERQEEAAPIQGAKSNIMEYVSRLKPLVKDDFQKDYDEFWMQILELEEVKQQVYNKGKQQDTTFNRNLVARMIHQIGDRVYIVGINDQQYAEYLEPGKGKNHSVRQQLCLMPEAPIKKAIERFLENK